MSVRAERPSSRTGVSLYIVYIDMQLPGTKPSEPDVRPNVLAGIYTQEDSAQGLGKSFCVIVKKVNSLIK